MTKKIISVLLVLAMLFGMAACTKKNGGKNNEPNTTGSGINAPSPTAPGILSPTGGGVNAPGNTSEPAVQAAAHTVLDAYPFDDTREEKLLRWARRAAEHNMAMFGYDWDGQPYNVDYVMLDVKSLDLGYAGGAEIQKWVELYEVVAEYYPEGLEPSDWDFEYEEQVDGGIIPDWSNSGEAWKYFAVYVRTEPYEDAPDGELSRTVLAGYFSELDCDYIHEELSYKGMPDKYYSAASYASEQGDALLDYDAEYSLNQFGPYIPSNKDCCVFFEGVDTPFGPGLKDDFEGVYGIEVFDEAHVWLEDGYQPADAWYAAYYPGIACSVYFNGASGSNTLYGIETEREDASTYRGLKIGDSEARLKELYPEIKKDGDIPVLMEEEAGVSYYWLKDEPEAPYGPVLILKVQAGQLRAIYSYDIFD